MLSRGKWKKILRPVQAKRCFGGAKEENFKMSVRHWHGLSSGQIIRQNVVPSDVNFERGGLKLTWE